MNISWPGFSAWEIKERFGFKECYLLNDFEAVGYYLPFIDIDKEFHLF